MTSKMHIGQDIAHTLEFSYSPPVRREGRREERKREGERKRASLSGLDYLVKYARQAEFLVIAGSGGRSSRLMLARCVRVCAHRKSQCVGKHALVT